MRSPSVVLFGLLACTARAQTVTFGFQGGVPAQTPLGRNTSALPFEIGPTVNIRLMPRFSLQSGFLYHRLGTSENTYAFTYPENTYISGFDRWRGKAFEIPFLLRYNILGERRSWQPFVSAGAAVRRTSIDSTTARSVLSGNVPANQYLPSYAESHSVNWNLDPMASVGVSFKAGRVRVEPEVRYSYWGAGTNSLIRKNQVHFLFGLRF